MKRVTISVINDLATDQRLHRMASTLSSEGFEVHMVGRYLGNPWPLKFPHSSSRRFRMLFKKGPLFYAFYNIRLLAYLLFVRKPDLLIAIDLDTLMPNSIVSRMRKTPLIYDSHELFTEVPELIGRPRVKAFWESIEHKYLPGIEHAITVSESISNYYDEKYAMDFYTIRNVSWFREKVLQKPEASDLKWKLIYQGALNLGRGIELLIESMQYLEDCVLYIVGTGDVQQKLHSYSTELGLDDRVEFLGRKEAEELHKLTSSCDLGFSLEEDMGLSYQMSLPNKIFDYIQARIPIVCSELPEMAALVKTYGIGEVSVSRDAKKLAEQVKDVLARTEVFKIPLNEAAKILCWENEQIRLINIVEKAISGEKH